MIPAVLKSFASSEKALAALIPTVGVTVALLMGKVTYEQWSDFTLWALGIYVSGKTVQGAASAIAAKPTTPATVVVAEGGKSS